MIRLHSDVTSPVLPTRFKTRALFQTTSQNSILCPSKWDTQLYIECLDWLIISSCYCLECYHSDRCNELGTREYRGVSNSSFIQIHPSHISRICTPEQISSYTCPGGNVFFTASVIWGAIGPARIFSPGALYSSLLWFFLLGAFSPIITYLLVKRWPKSFFRYLSTPVMFGSLGAIPPATAYNYLCWYVLPHLIP